MSKNEILEVFNEWYSTERAECENLGIKVDLHAVAQFAFYGGFNVGAGRREKQELSDDEAWCEYAGFYDKDELARARVEIIARGMFIKELKLQNDRLKKCIKDSAEIHKMTVGKLRQIIREE